MKTFVWVLASTIGLSSPIVAAAAPGAAAAALYGSVCSACHGSTFAGGSRGPALKGPNFLAHWKRKSAYDLYSLILLTMPSDNPGIVNEKEGVGLVEEIFKQNGLKGSFKHVKSPEDLKSIPISK
jgi:mono/diheme cytochrome c family protein